MYGVVDPDGEEHCVFTFSLFLQGGFYLVFDPLALDGGLREDEKEFVV